MGCKLNPATVRWPSRRGAHSPKGYMWADERIRAICAFNDLDAYVKRIVSRPTPHHVGMRKTRRQDVGNGAKSCLDAEGPRENDQWV
jgi:hypothetical protein